MRLFITTSFFIAIAFFCFGQSINLSFDRLGAEDGLSSGFNDFIYKDSREFVWISSLEGLYRFDGIEMKKYPDGSATANGIRGKYIQSDLYENGSGDFWFTTFDWINFYDREKDQFSAFRLMNENGDTIENGYSIFHLEGDSILWLKAEEDIYKYNVKKKSQEQVIETKGIRFAIDTLENGKIKNIFACLWESGSGFELISFLENGIPEKKYYWEKGIPGTDLKQIEVSKAIVQEDGIAWLFSNKGLLSFDKTKGTFNFHKTPIKNDKVIGGTILNENQLLLVAIRSGIWLFDTREKVFLKNYNQNQNSDLISNEIRASYKDAHEHVWLASENAGVEHSWLFKNNFETPLDKLQEKQLSINSIVEDSANRIWCSTKSSGVYILGNDSSIVEIESDPNANEYLKGTHQLSVNHNGEVWAINNRFVSRFGTKTRNAEIVFDAKKIKLHDLIHLSSKDKIILTDKGGYWLSTESPEKTMNRRVIKPGLTQSFKFFKGLDSMIYFPSEHKELIIYKTGIDSLYLLNKIPIDFYIYTIWKDEINDNLWIGSAKGLFRLEKGGLKFQALFTEQDPLWNTQIFGVTGDDKRRLWLSTNKGLWRFNPETRELFQFHEEDGLPSGQFSFFSNLKSKEGKIWLGTNNGLLGFYPDSIRPYPHSPSIQIKGLKVNHVSFSTPDYIGETKELHFKYDENTFEFDVVAITSYLPHLNTLYYQLEGYTDGWQQVENGEPIPFFKVPHGKHSLKVYGRNANNLKGDTKTLVINIAPPFWKTYWFWIPTVLGITLMGYLVFRKVLRERLKKQEIEFERQKREQALQFKREQEMKEVLQEERNRIASEMHDDMGGGLNTIQILLRRFRKEKLSLTAQNSLLKIEDYAAKSIEDMREIIWAMNSSYDKLPTLIAYTRRFVLEYFDDHHIDCKANAPADIPNIDISGEKRRNILLAVKESVHNIVKHTNASEVEVTFSLKNNLEISIKDNGKGFDPEKESDEGNGLRNMRKRMEAINGTIVFENKEGTKVILSIPIFV